jgi:hypothetical protein
MRTIAWKLGWEKGFGIDTRNCDACLVEDSERLSAVVDDDCGYTGYCHGVGEVKSAAGLPDSFLLFSPFSRLPLLLGDQVTAETMF